MPKSPVCGNSPALPKTQIRLGEWPLDTMEQRAAAFADANGIDPAPIAYDPDEPGEVLITDELIDYCNREGLSLDWLVVGDITQMLRHMGSSGRTASAMAAAFDTMAPNVREAARLALRLATQGKLRLDDGLRLIHEAIGNRVQATGAAEQTAET